MIKEINGDIFASTCQVIVNPVNTEGVMGAGLAKEFKKKFPSYASWWKDICTTVSLSGGSVYITHEPGRDGFIASFATKENWRNPSKLEWIERGLKLLAEQMKAQKLTAVALPRLGCGLGGLNWRDVKPLIAKHLGEIPTVEIYSK